MPRLYSHRDRPVHLGPLPAERLAREVTALYTCGPAGGGGVRTALRERLGSLACLVPRERVPMRVEFMS